MYLDTYSRHSVSSIKRFIPRYRGRHQYNMIHSLPDHICRCNDKPHKISLSRNALKFYLDITRN